MYAVQQGLAASAFGDVMGVPAWKTLRSWYLVAADDQAIPPDAERMFASRMGATTVEIPASHVAMVSRPGDVAQLIKTAAGAVLALFEETGLSVRPDQFGSVVAVRSGNADISWMADEFSDVFFFHRIGRHDVDIRGLEQLEASTFIEYRWWSVSDLAQSEPIRLPCPTASATGRSGAQECRSLACSGTWVAVHDKAADHCGRGDERQSDVREGAVGGGLTGLA